MTVETAIEPAAAPSIRPTATRVLLVTAVYVTAVIAAAIYPLVSPLRDASFITVEGQLVSVLNGAVWLAVLLIVFVRQPDGRLWKLIFVWSLASRIYAFSFVPDSLVWSIARPLEILAIAAYVHLAIAYPTGNLRSRFDRGVVLYVYALLVGQALLAHPFWEVTVACVPDCVRNVFAIWPNEEIYGVIADGTMVLAVVTVVPLILTALWRHWRDASPAGRRALLPVVVAFPIEAALAAADALVRAVGFEPGIAFFDGPSGVALLLVVPMILPIGLLITFLRPRLNRGRMAGLVVELGRGVPLGGLRDVLARALGDPSLQLAFAAPSGSGYVDAAGQPVDLPVGDPTRTVTRLERGDELLGVLVHDPLIEVEDPGLVEAVGNAARLALENERLAAEVRAQLEEVRASRVRIVEAADAERRRVERDLHDGAQQRLVALAMRLQVAKQTTPEASALLDAATTELETAIGEVRGLARGVHPTILTESGLAAAVDALAERTTIPVVADVVDGRFDATVEATAYFVVAEALTNVVRYSGAGRARVDGPQDRRHAPGRRHRRRPRRRRPGGWLRASRARRSGRCHRRSTDGHESGRRRDDDPCRAAGPRVGRDRRARRARRHDPRRRPRVRITRCSGSARSTRSRGAPACRCRESPRPDPGADRRPGRPRAGRRRVGEPGDACRRSSRDVRAAVRLPGAVQQPDRRRRQVPGPPRPLGAAGRLSGHLDLERRRRPH